MKTRSLTYINLDQAAEILRQGGLVAFPTETVFGLGVVYDDEQAFNRLVSVKNRRPDKPFTLMCAAVDDIEHFAYVSDVTRAILDTFLPGPLTIILPVVKKMPVWVHLNTGKVGIRVSNLQTIQSLIMKVGKPLLVPSANKAEQPPALTPDEVLAVFDGEIDALVFGNVTSGTPSTVIEIDQDDNIKLIRQGMITLEQIKLIKKEHV